MVSTFKSPWLLSLATVLLVTLIHTASLTVFMKGFLLTRTEFSNRTPSSNAHTSLKRYSRAVILVVDALRDDFLIPQENAFDSTMHNRLTFPQKITAEHPETAAYFRFIADPPTTTLQRLKGLTTGSLPTFIEAAANFDPDQQGEDSWPEQASNAGMKIAFVGDNTWMSLYPSGVFSQNMSYPQDSFDVYDLDTVDNAVKHYLSSLLDAPKGQPSQFDILVAHNLGLDHSGHRYGPSHSETTRKLDETNDLIAHIVASLRDDDLFLIFGDHGMDTKGDHGGDTPLELSAGLWMYSKKGLFPQPLPEHGNAANPLKDMLSNDVIFHNSLPIEAGYNRDSILVPRPVPQVSLVPTLSLLMGLPIPFSNLGPIIPELFLYPSGSNWNILGQSWNFDTLALAARTNAEQVQNYLEILSSDKSHYPEFAEQVNEYKRKLLKLDSMEDIVKAELHLAFVHTSLARARVLWTKFDISSMILGIVPLGLSIITIGFLIQNVDLDGSLNSQSGSIYPIVKAGFVFGTFSALFIFACGFLLSVTGVYLQNYTNLSLFTFAMISQAAMLLKARTNDFLTIFYQHFSKNLLAYFILIGHCVVFGSNSTTLSEPFIVNNLLVVGIFTFLVSSVSFPRKDLRRNGLVSFGATIVLLRTLQSWSTCKEEVWGSICAANLDQDMSKWLVWIMLPLSSVLPEAIGKILDFSGSREGVAKLWVNFLLRIWLVFGTTYWIVSDIHTPINGAPILDMIKKWSGQSVVAGVPLAAILAWPILPMPITLENSTSDDQEGNSRQVVLVKGFANCMGTMYSLFWMCGVALTWGVNQFPGQLAIAIGVLAILGLSEGYDFDADSQELRKGLFASVAASQSGKPEKNNDASQVSPSGRRPDMIFIFLLALIGYQLFFATGHEAAISSIQWKAAFVGTRRGEAMDVVNIWSILLVVINTLGPNVLVSALWVPALAMWKVAPEIKQSAGEKSRPLGTIRHILSSSLVYILYQSAIATISCICAVILRRHLMFWRIFAPRTLLSVLILLNVDWILLLLGVGFGTFWVLRKAEKTFGSTWR